MAKTLTSQPKFRLLYTTYILFFYNNIMAKTWRLSQISHCYLCYSMAKTWHHSQVSLLAIHDRGCSCGPRHISYFGSPSHGNASSPNRDKAPRGARDYGGGDTLLWHYWTVLGVEGVQSALTFIGSLHERRQTLPSVWKGSTLPKIWVWGMNARVRAI